MSWQEIPWGGCPPGGETFYFQSLGLDNLIVTNLSSEDGCSLKQHLNKDDMLAPVSVSCVFCYSLTG